MVLIEVARIVNQLLILFVPLAANTVADYLLMVLIKGPIIVVPCSITVIALRGSYY